MYSSPSSSSQAHHSTPINNPTYPFTTTTTTTTLTRYGSAPDSFLSATVDSVVGLSQPHHHDNRGLTRSSLIINSAVSTQSKATTLTFLKSHHEGFHNNNFPTSELTRHSSSPADFLNHLTSDIGLLESKDNEYYRSQGGCMNEYNLSRSSTQLSFKKPTDHQTLSQNPLRATAHRRSTPSTSFSLSWDDNNNNNCIVFSTSSSTSGARCIDDDDFLNGLAAMESQTALEVTTMDGQIHIPSDSMPFKIRAKRGCATHPRSIAERERRTRISERLKKLQMFFPNVDKQTSYADMLDLAVQHIKDLQSEIQELNEQLGNCTCGNKQNRRC